LCWGLVVPLTRKLLFHQGSSGTPVKTPAEDYRVTAAALWLPDGTSAVRVASGAVFGSGTPGFSACQVVPGSGQVTVKPGRVVVQGNTVGQGAYTGTIDTDQVRTLAAATVGPGLPSAGQFKGGRVLIRVYDQLYGDGQDGWDVEVHQGASAASAGAAALPALPSTGSLLQVQTYTVNSSGTLTLTGTTPFVSPLGSIQPVVADGLTAVGHDGASGVFDGQYRDRARRLERWSASPAAWYPTTTVRSVYDGVYQSTTQTLVSGLQQWMPVFFQSPLTTPKASQAMWSAAQPSRMTAPIRGFYVFTGGVVFDPDSRGDRGARFALNGTAVVYGTTARVKASDQAATSVPVRTSVMLLAAGDYIELQAVQTCTINLNTGLNLATGEVSSLWGYLLEEA
jgi:hypothetical protein